VKEKVREREGVEVGSLYDMLMLKHNPFLKLILLLLLPNRF